MRRSEVTGWFFFPPEIVLRPPAFCSQGTGCMHSLWIFFPIGRAGGSEWPGRYQGWSQTTDPARESSRVQGRILMNYILVGKILLQIGATCWGGGQTICIPGKDVMSRCGNQGPRHAAIKEHLTLNSALSEHHRAPPSKSQG